MIGAKGWSSACRRKLSSGPLMEKGWYWANMVDPFCRLALNRISYPLLFVR
jgi:hypothetical protein